MSNSDSTRHVYAREIKQEEVTSLSVLAALIPAGARVLDIGCGNGAIGRYLTQRDGPATGPIDGLTINKKEAQLARAHYSKVEVANLENSRLTDLFEHQSYDFIICADILEHITQGERVLSECTQLLAPHGRTLISIPNAAYAGLVAELMSGEFRYRPEGLLDATHLRFYTRRTLMRFLRDNHWVAEHVDTIVRQLPDSEFHVAFDTLPPAVANYLLALPDALTYQFIVTARPQRADEPAMDIAAADELLPAQALFTSQLYLKFDGPFEEKNKLTSAGVIGQERQSLNFRLPADTTVTGLKWDPADRAGYLHLYSIHLYDRADRVLWQWHAQDLEMLVNARSDGIVAQPPTPLCNAYRLLLHSDDPWIELSIPTAALAGSSGGKLSVELGWPMSADYLALAASAEQRVQSLLHANFVAEQEYQQQHEYHRQQIGALAQQLESHSQNESNLTQQNKLLRDQKHTLLQHTHTLSRERDEALKLVHDIENSTVFRVTRPIVHAKMRIDRLLGIGSARKHRTNEQLVTHPLSPEPHPVDIIVPVYKGLEDTQRCLQSVLVSNCSTSWRLVVINDASPEPELTAWLRQFASINEHIVLLENEQNLGFVGTVNRGMAFSEHNDVVLLNSDTEVANDWLDRIRRAAYSDQRVASVTPFSNNATICSYPRFCEDNDLPDGWDTVRLDAIFARVNAAQVIDVPTGVGFCMYIRRAALCEVGLFDVEKFGKGYGEENDFCVRAANAGWRNLHALDTFVRHFGGISFGTSKSPRERAAMQTLRRLHSRYEADVQRFVRNDPARSARSAIDIARILDGHRPVILAVLHDRSGGTERHVVELAHQLRDVTQFLVLRPLPGKRVSLRLPDLSDHPHEGFELTFKLADDEDALLALLRHLSVRHIHIHHLLGHSDFIRQLPARLGVSYDFTSHDYYFADPQITLTDASGRYSAERDPAFEKDEASRARSYIDSNLVAWRECHAQLLNAARYVIAPSCDMLTRLIAVVPAAPLKLVPHTDIDRNTPLPTPIAPKFVADRPLRVAVIGALSIIKGADVLEDVAIAAAKQKAPIEFHLIGYAYRSLQTQPKAHLTVHGRYDDTDLADLLQWLQPDLIWFPAQWPETYSYTLSACLQGGWPVVVPDLGAFAERVEARPWSWVRPWDQSAQQWLDFFIDVRAHHFIPSQSPEPIVISNPRLALMHRISAQSPDWYRQCYLADIPASADDASVPEALWQPYLSQPDNSLLSGAKNQTLQALVRLRSLPILGSLARSIPSSWQTKIKSWLRR